MAAVLRRASVAWSFSGASFSKDASHRTSDRAMSSPTPQSSRRRFKNSSNSSTPVYVTVRQARALLPSGVRASKEAVLAVNTFLDELVIRFCAELPTPVTLAAMRNTIQQMFLPGSLQDACLEACTPRSANQRSSKKFDLLERMFGCWTPYTSGIGITPPSSEGAVNDREFDRLAECTQESNTKNLNELPLNGVELCNLFRSRGSRTTFLRSGSARMIHGPKISKQRKRAYTELLLTLGSIIREVARRLAMELGLHAQRCERRTVGVRDLLALLDMDPQLEAIFRCMQLRDDLRMSLYPDAPHARVIRSTPSFVRLRPDTSDNETHDTVPTPIKCLPITEEQGLDPALRQRRHTVHVLPHSTSHRSNMSAGTESIELEAAKYSRMQGAAIAEAVAASSSLPRPGYRRRHHEERRPSALSYLMTPQDSNQAIMKWLESAELADPLEDADADVPQLTLDAVPPPAVTIDMNAMPATSLLQAHLPNAAMHSFSSASMHPLHVSNESPACV